MTENKGLTWNNKPVTGSRCEPLAAAEFNRSPPNEFASGDESLRKVGIVEEK
jgi:hypothetical protein